MRKPSRSAYYLSCPEGKQSRGLRLKWVLLPAEKHLEGELTRLSQEREVAPCRITLRPQSCAWRRGSDLDLTALVVVLPRVLALHPSWLRHKLHSRAGGRTVVDRARCCPVRTPPHTAQRRVHRVRRRHIRTRRIPVFAAPRSCRVRHILGNRRWRLRLSQSLITTLDTFLGGCGE